MRLRVSVTQLVTAAEVVGGVRVVPPEVVGGSGEGEFEGGHRVDVEEGGDGGANCGRLHGVAVDWVGFGLEYCVVFNFR